MYRRRIIVFLALAGLVMLTLAARLAYVQFVLAEGYIEDAERYLQEADSLPAVRGRISDRHGRLLAVDEPCYDLSLDYRFMTSEEKWIPRAARKAAVEAGQKLSLAARWISRQQEQIAKSEGLSPQQAEEVFARRWRRTWELTHESAAKKKISADRQVRRVVARIDRISRGGRRNVRELYQAHPVVSGLTDSEAVALKAELDGTVGMRIHPSRRRTYPRGETACHVVGLTGRITAEYLSKAKAELRTRVQKNDWRRWRRESYSASDMVGKSGVEWMCEDTIRGRHGYQLQRRGTLIEEAAAQPGQNVQLSIDSLLQEQLAAAFTDRYPDGTGAIVVLDIETGQVLALVSIPTYDLNSYRRDFPRLVKEVIRLPLRHRAVTQCYAPGSTVKPITALAALSEGRITPGTPFTCTGKFSKSPNGKPACWTLNKGFSHGSIDLVQAIRGSCNVYFDNVGHVLGPRRLTDWLRSFGFGEQPGTGLGAESSGIVASDELMFRRQGRRMSSGDAWNMAIGQGTFSATPLHVANAMATIAREGQFISPQLVIEGGPTTTRNTRSLPIAPGDSQAVWRGMRDVVHHSKGTAHKVLMENGLAELDFEFCGKTGTAQVPPQRVDTDDDGRLDTIVRTGDAAWFAGFAPYRNPKIAFAILVEYVEGGGGRNAGPVAMDTIRICESFGYVR